MIMLDFLSEEKRKTLLQYPFIKDFLEGRLNKENFLDNLKAFKKELLDKDITEAEIETLKQQGLEDWMEIVKKKISLCQRKINSGRLTGRAESSASLLKPLFKDYNFPTNDEILFDVNMAESAEDWANTLYSMMESFGFKSLTKKFVRGKFLQDGQKTIIDMYRKLNSKYNSRENALLALGRFFTMFWKFGKIIVGEKMVFDYKTKISALDVIANYGFEIKSESFKSEIIEYIGSYEGFLKEIKKYNFFPEFSKEDYEFYHFLTDLFGVREIWGYVPFFDHGKYTRIRKMNFMELTKKENSLLEDLSKNPKVILKKRKEYIYLFSKIWVMAFIRVKPAKSPKFMYDIFVLVDNSIIVSRYRTDIFRGKPWGRISLGTHESVVEGILGIICIVSNKFLYKKVIKKMLELTEHDKELRVPIFDTNGKLIWPKV